MSRSSSEHSDLEGRFYRQIAGESPAQPNRNPFFVGPPYSSTGPTGRRPSSPLTADTSSLPDSEVPITPSIRITHPSEERVTVFRQFTEYESKKMSLSQPAGSFTGIESPMTPPPSTYDIYTPNPLDTPKLYTDAIDTTQTQYSAFPLEQNAFRRRSYADDVALAGVPKTRIRTRRLMRKFKQIPSTIRFALLLGSIGVLALLCQAAPRMRSSTQGSSIWIGLQRQFSRGLGAIELCDPTYGDGFVNQENVWERADGACSSSHLLHRFRNTPKTRYQQEFPEFINKTVFIYGDSVGRHLFDDYCHYLKMDFERRPFPGQEEPVIYWEGAVCTEPNLNFKVTHLHNYGFANTSESNEESMAIVKRAFPGGPWDFETRITRLFDEALPDLKPDFVQMNGGAWDFLWMYNRDIKFRQYNDVIPQEDLRMFQQRLKELINFVREKFPEAKPLWIDPHWLNPNDLNVRHAWSGPYYHMAPLNQTEDSPLLPPLFTPRRQSQHRHALHSAAEETGVDIVDYWKIKDSFAPDEYFTGLDRVHPIEEPRAVVIDMLLEKMHRWFTYGI
ncbi:hypothetical protein NliqN6_4509 [Naganishia liquefaciens]|uniref:Uncharacterized protein n=1 Tax=Naganishia liquefaciens TaxID=104408 RepID=A0A8H3YHE5_9TREE|nr:hypothetical protein NliqN6_4509 [Naganishia liquefaciens]